MFRTFCHQNNNRNGYARLERKKPLPASFLVNKNDNWRNNWIEELGQGKVKSISAHPGLVNKEWVPFYLC